MRGTSLTLAGPRCIRLEEIQVAPPGPGQVMVSATMSAISAGTELLAYRGQTPAGTSATAGRPDAASCGYSLVGRVVQVGPGVEQDWLERRVFAFQPHCSHFLAEPDELLPLPEDLDDENAVFLPNMETAVNLVHDGQPLLGERVAVLGLGIVGLLTTSLVSRFPLSELVCIDPLAARRQAALRLGASVSREEARQTEYFDLCYEVSGHPATLNQAIAATAFAGRIVVGSWYGDKRAEIDLGGSFHRSRIRILSSQVSTLAPALTGGWTKNRRLDVALHWLQQVKPARLITHRFPINRATEAFELLDGGNQDTIQVLLTYG